MSEFKDPKELFRKMTPEQKRQALEALRKLESQPQVYVETEGGNTISVPLSVYKKSQKQKDK